MTVPRIFFSPVAWIAGFAVAAIVLGAWSGR